MHILQIISNLPPTILHPLIMLFCIALFIDTLVASDWLIARIRKIELSVQNYEGKILLEVLFSRNKLRHLLKQVSAKFQTATIRKGQIVYELTSIVPTRMSFGGHRCVPMSIWPKEETVLISEVKLFCNEHDCEILYESK